MKTATFQVLDGGTFTVEYDENAPCQVCGKPVVIASTSGTSICPWCDMGHCRYCGVSASLGDSQAWREHMLWHRDNPPAEVSSVER